MFDLSCGAGNVEQCSLSNRPPDFQTQESAKTQSVGYGPVPFLSCLPKRRVRRHALGSSESWLNLGDARESRKAAMFTTQSKADEARIGLFRPDHGRRRLCMAATAATAALLLSACGGGGGNGYVRPPGNLNIGVAIGGQPGSYSPIAPGGSLDIAIHAGQTLNLDAGEPVVWNILIGGTAVTYGAQVYYAGVNIRTTNLSQSAVAVSTYAQYPLPASVPITLVATSTYDSFQVATVYLLIVN